MRYDSDFRADKQQTLRSDCPPRAGGPNVEVPVAAIIADVRARGDAALLNTPRSALTACGWTDVR